MVAWKNDYHANGLIVVVVCDNPWYHLTRDMIGEAVERWLGIPRRDIDVPSQQNTPRRLSSRSSTSRSALT
jgi:hypothetical protein